jgi:hypothetical protein
LAILCENEARRSLCVMVNRSELIEWELGTATGKKERQENASEGSHVPGGPLEVESEEGDTARQQKDSI